jgi:molybdopterin molybdotransferase
MASLSRLCAAFPDKITIWPFEPLTKPITLVEVWPSLYTTEIRAA